MAPGAIDQRLRRLERQVEAVLAPGEARIGRDVVTATVDETLELYASVRRGLAATLARGALGGVLDAFEAGTVEVRAAVAEATLRALSRYWWRVEAFGLDRVPASGRVLLVVNRAGGMLPYDALVLALALRDARRPARALVDGWFAHLPLVGSALGRAGLLGGTPAVARRLLERDEAVVVHPEGTHAFGKRFARRYRLASFGRGGFARVAIETGAPIVPIALVGAEESQPVLGRVDGLGRLLGLPTLPLTATFPWLGLPGLVPLPTKWTLHVGDPLDTAARTTPADARDPALVGRLRDQVRERLQALVTESVRRRRSVFLG